MSATAHPRPSHAETQMLRAMATMTDELRVVKDKVEAMEKSGIEHRAEFADVREMVTETKDIVEAWAAVKTFGKFIKWLGALVAAVTAVAIGVKLGVQHLFGRM